MVENLPGIQETQAASLGHEDPLEKGMATHSSILAWRIPWTLLLVFFFFFFFFLASLVAQTVKNLRTLQETWVQSLGQEDSREKGMATHSSILV